jgi:hypothetical protein
MCQSMNAPCGLFRRAHTHVESLSAFANRTVRDARP